jgi:hypothetical protein
MNKKLAIASVLIGLAAFIRLLPHPNNITPIAAMALMGGMYVGRNYLAFLVPLIALFVSDLILNNTINKMFFTDQTGFILWNEYMNFTYPAFILTVFLGYAIKHFSGFRKIIAGAFLSSLLFFVITNFGTWMSGHLYPNNIAGLSACFAAAIPFFWNTLIGNLFYTALFVVGIELAMGYSLKPVKA